MGECVEIIDGVKCLATNRDNFVFIEVPNLLLVACKDCIIIEQRNRSAMGRYVGEFDINRGHGRCRIIICADSGEGVPSFRGGGGCADPCVVPLLANRIWPVDVNHAGPGIL